MKMLGFALLSLATCSGNASAANGKDQPAGPVAADAGADAQSDTNSFELSSGVDYSVGKYGAAADTSVKSVPLEAKAQVGRLRVQATLPYVWIKGPGQIVGGVVVGSSNPTAVAARQGVGDLSLAAAYRVSDEHGALPTIELGGTAKLPSASMTIGTGQVDYGANVVLYKTVGPQVTAFGSLGYSWLGSPATYRLKNGVSAYGGINFRPDPAVNLGASLSYREPVANGVQGQAAVSPYVSYRFSRHFGLTGYTTAGLNDASPQLGAGLRLTLFQ